MGARRRAYQRVTDVLISIDRGGDEYWVEVEGTVEADGAVEDIGPVAYWSMPGPIRLTDAEVRVAELALLEALS